MTTATSVLSAPLDNLRKLVAASATFQTWTSTANATAALAKVHMLEPDDAAASYPLCLVDWQSWAFINIASGNPNLFKPEGEMGLMFEAAIDSSDRAKSTNPATIFANQVGAILAEMMDLSGQPGYLMVQSITLVEPPIRFETNYVGTPGDFFRVRFAVVWAY